MCVDHICKLYNMQNFFILLKKVVNSENLIKYKHIKPGKSKKERLIVTDSKFAKNLQDCVVVNVLQ